jgi:antiviral helicase SKI2
MLVEPTLQDAKEELCKYFLEPHYISNEGYQDIFDISNISIPVTDKEKQICRVVKFEPFHFTLKRDLFTGKITNFDSLSFEDSEILSITTPSFNGRDTEDLKKKESYSRMVDSTTIPPDFDLVVPKFAREYPFTLDIFQKQAIYHLERNESVFVAAHTSAGKTVVAEYAIALAGRHLTRAIYTSPIKALSNQKFRDLRETFGEGAVGLLTGDTQIIPRDSSEWLVTVMTTEILRSMLYRGGESIRDVEFVIFDEVHYINDAERGVVWEEVIIMLPRSVKIILLSATIPNAIEFADWVGRARLSQIYVISTTKRPVPLEHWIYQPPNKIVQVIDSERKLLSDNYNSQLITNTNKKGITGTTNFTNLNWPEFIYFLKKKSLMPVVVFTFSRRRCQEQAESLSGVDLTAGAHEVSQIHRLCDDAFKKLSLIDRTLPQITQMREMLSRGIGVHHSGLLPLIKELVEILFSKALVRVLFATETFAMGVNMPARTVVFTSLKKHDGANFRGLTPGEYTQMAGRAGRRGRDSVGTVIIATPEVPSLLLLQEIILGTGNRLTSQFRLTYPMILNLLKAESIKVEEMIKRSFGENASQRSLPEQQELLKTCKLEHAKLSPVSCPLCAPLLSTCVSSMEEIKRYNTIIYEQLFQKLPKIFEKGRVVLLSGGLEPVVITKTLKNQLSGFIMSNPQVLEVPFLVPIPLIDLEHLEKGSIINFVPADIAYILDLKMNVDSEDLRYLEKKFREAIREQAALSEYSIPLFKNIELDEKVLKRQNLLRKLPYLECPDALSHYLQFYRISSLTERLADLQISLNDGNLTLMPEYEARVQVLKHLGYVNADGSVTLKGRVAAELATVDALIMTELLFENWIGGFDHAQVVALLSSMVFQDHSLDNPNDLEIINGPLKGGAERILQVANALESVQRSFGVVDLSEATPNRLNFHLIPVVEQWARGTPFVSLLQLIGVAGEIPEGAIVRCIVRLDETCRELKGVARLMGEWNLAEKMDSASLSIKRDICFASSLYI